MNMVRHKQGDLPPLTEARKGLANFMFTPDDYEKLTAVLLARYLNQLSRMDRDKYGADIKALQPGQRDRKVTGIVMHDMVISAGIPARYEMRIPVAIDTKHMFMPNCEERTLNKPAKPAAKAK